MNDESLDLFYVKGKEYAITIQPDDKVQFYGEDQRLHEFYEYYRHKLERLMCDVNDFNYWFQIEYSEPHGSVTGMGPRLHLHGIIYLKSRKSVWRWLSLIMPDMLQHARLEISNLNDKKAWLNYCKKQAYYIPTPNNLSNYQPGLEASEGAIVM